MSYPTPDFCTDFTDCGVTATVPTGNINNSGFSQSIVNTIGTDTSLYQLKTNRMFSISAGIQTTKNINKLVSYDGGVFQCGEEGTTSASATIKEDCSIFKRIPYYIDRTNNIYVVKEISEKLNFEVTSNKVAVFRQAYGNMSFNKILIKKGNNVKGSEKFYLIRSGVKSILAETTYEFNPFGITGPQRIYGLNGAVVEQDNRYGAPEPDVAQVICFPLPPSLGIPLDPDIAAYGFYDYMGLEEGTGGQFSKLTEDDGGQDFFYPAWCRAMETDPTWQETRTRRFELNFPGVGIPKPELRKNVAWRPIDPEVYSFPFGSFAIDKDDNYIYSSLLEFSPKAKGEIKIIHQSSIGDLKKAIFTNNNIDITDNWIMTPVTPL